MSLRYKKGEPVVVDCSKDKGFTVQSDRDDADINKIIAKFEKGQFTARINSKEPFYGDVSEFEGLAESMEKINKANDLFMQYPAELRERFDNDPRKFVEFFEDEGNLKEAIELGLAVPRPAETTAEAAPETPTGAA